MITPNGKLINFNFDIPDSPRLLHNICEEITSQDFLEDFDVSQVKDVVPLTCFTPSRTESTTATVKIQDEPLQFYLPPDSVQELKPKLQPEERGLGVWIFDTKKKQRKYISLTGKQFTGIEALQQSRRDKDSELHPVKSSRNELRYLMSLTPQTRFDLMKSNVYHHSSPNVVHPSTLSLSSWGLPIKTVSRYLSRGIHSLFPWQVDCLLKDEGAPLFGYNLVYSAPTSGGKTLVSEILMLRVLGLASHFSTTEESASIQQRESESSTSSIIEVSTSIRSLPPLIFFVVPFVSLAEEKMTYFQEVWSDMHIGVRAFHGGGDDAASASARGLTDDVDVAVCTIERANILLNQLLEEGKERRLRLVVVDEIHLLSDKNRGFLLEVLLSKIKYLLSDPKPSSLSVSPSPDDRPPPSPPPFTQVIGMSATLPNIEHLANWLGASLYTTQYRPVSLDVRVSFDRQIYSVLHEDSSSSQSSMTPLSSTSSSFESNSEETKKRQRESTGDPVLEEIDQTLLPLAHPKFENEEALHSPPNPLTANLPSNAISSLLFDPPLSLPLLPSPPPPSFPIQTPDPSYPPYIPSLPASSTTTPTLLAVPRFLPNDPRRYFTLHPPSSAISQVESSSSSFSSSPSTALSSMPPPLLGDEKEDRDGWRSLVGQTMASGRSVMVFCSSKRKCELSAGKLADTLENHIKQSKRTSSPYETSSIIPIQKHPRQIIFPLVSSEMQLARSLLLEKLSQTDVGLCPILKRSIPFGVVYHHGGLTVEERRLIEEAYRTEVVLVIITTSTLSAGVNLPAHRVIIREPRMGPTTLTVSTFRQMCGRAGRMGIDKQGEAILMISGQRRDELELARHLTQDDIDPLVSSLHEGQGGGLEKLILEMVCCGRLNQESQIYQFINCTLMSVQHESALVLRLTRNAIHFLKSEQFLLQTVVPGSPHERGLEPTPLGIATTHSGIAPRDAVLVLEPLMKARRKLILKGGLHAVFLVTPPSIAGTGSLIEPDWDRYEEVLHFLYQEHPDAREVAEYLGINPGQLMAYRRKKPPSLYASYQQKSSHSQSKTNLSSKSTSSEPTTSTSHISSSTLQQQQQSEEENIEEWKLAMFYRRFYSSILLFSLIQEWAITKVTDRMADKIARGQLQQLQKDASAFCGMTVVFCKKLNWHHLASCLEVYQSRLSFGIRPELLPLVRIGPEMPGIRAREFVKRGIHSPSEVLLAGVDRVTQILMESLPFDIQDPLTAKTSSETNLSSTHDSRRDSCYRLANRIIARAREAIQEELELNFK